MTDRQSERNWHYRDLTRSRPTQGPFYLYEIVERIQAGKVRSDDLIRCGEGEWVQATQVPELTKTLRSQRFKDELTLQIAGDAARVVSGDSGFQKSLDYNRDPRNLPWIGLFVGGLLLLLFNTALMTLGNLERMVVSLIGVTLVTTSLALILAAVIRWAVQPLVAQQVDTNNHLKRIAAQLQDASAAMEQRAQQASEEPVA